VDVVTTNPEVLCCRVNVAYVGHEIVVLLGRVDTGKVTALLATIGLGNHPGSCRLDELPRASSRYTNIGRSDMKRLALDDPTVQATVSETFTIASSRRQEVIRARLCVH